MIIRDKDGDTFIVPISTLVLARVKDKDVKGKINYWFANSVLPNRNGIDISKAEHDRLALMLKENSLL